MPQQNRFEKVKSRNIAEIGYNPSAKEIHVKFHYTGNKVYVYGPITRQRYNAMKMAASVGTYFNEYIRYKIPEKRRYNGGRYVE